MVGCLGSLAVLLQLGCVGAFVGLHAFDKSSLLRSVPSFPALFGRAIVSDSLNTAGGRSKMARNGLLGMRASVQGKWEQFILDIQKQIISEAEAADGKVGHMAQTHLSKWRKQCLCLASAMVCFPMSRSLGEWQAWSMQGMKALLRIASLTHPLLISRESSSRISGTGLGTAAMASRG